MSKIKSNLALKIKCTESTWKSPESYFCLCNLLTINGTFRKNDFFKWAHVLKFRKLIFIHLRNFSNIIIWKQSNQTHTDLTDSNYFQTLQLLILQHPLPASFHQQEGGALMVLIQSKKVKSVFSYLILGFLQSADSFLLLYSLLHFLLYHVL